MKWIITRSQLLFFYFFLFALGVCGYFSRLGWWGMTEPKEPREWTLQWINDIGKWQVIGYPSGNKIERETTSPPFARAIELHNYQALQAELEKVKEDNHDFRASYDKLVTLYENSQSELATEKARAQRLDKALDAIDDHIRKLRVVGILSMEDMIAALKIISQNLTEYKGGK